MSSSDDRRLFILRPVLRGSEAFARNQLGELGVRLALVHGSALRSERPRDVDVVVYTDLDPEEVALRVTEAVERTVRVEADVYAFSDVNEIDCFLLSAVKNGVLLYRDAGGNQGVDKGSELMQHNI